MGGYSKSQVPSVPAAFEGAHGMAFSAPERGTPRVLLVEDNVLLMKALARTMRANGWEVLTATNTKEARECIDSASADIDAAVVDYVLVEEYAENLIGTFRNLPRPCSALMITGVTEEDFGKKAIAAGADDFLFKPFRIKDFVSAVDRALARTRAWRARLEGMEDPGEKAASPRPQGSVPNIAVCAQRLADRSKLSSREREVLEALLAGHKNTEIAEMVGIKQRTVKFHIANLFRKLGVHSRGDLLRLVFSVPSSGGRKKSWLK